MAINNQERLFKAFGLLAEGLEEPVDEVMTKGFGTADWTTKWAVEDAARNGRAPQVMDKDDVQVLLRALTEKGYFFKDVLSRAQQGYASELREIRNVVMHGQAGKLNSDDTARALDTMERLLQAAGVVDSAKDVRGLRIDLQRTVFEDQTRKQVKRSGVSTTPDSGLRPWREVIRPHDDVARGEFTASEFAADLHLVHTAQALGSEYNDPIEFFTRTYLTEGLRDLLSRALRRVNGDGSASPVVNLQTNFGGGKTHSMLALYHLFSGTDAARLPNELQDLVADAGIERLEDLKVKRVALVGTYLKAGSPIIKPDGTEVRTLWGELAWQLGGREGYDLVAADDAAGTNPGDALLTLFQTYGPALILIDEWVAYARQLVTDKELPAGSFGTQFTFAQSLTEIVKSVPGVMLVVSIPASDTGADGGADIEIGGANGQLALERLQNVIRRVADQWRPSSKDESFEIVRRRLFQAPNAEGLTAISATARSFVTMYRSNKDLFPRDATTPGEEYETRIRASYPLHPELLDRLYEDWSTLERFQRTRGVLKLVSSIVHELWVSDDAAPLIMPGYVPLDASTVNTDLTQYLEEQWKPIIDSDIDGTGSTAAEIDRSRPALQARHVTQRIARTIFMGAAPRSRASRKGLDKQYVWLGTGTPGDTLGNFGSAIDQLAQRSTYFYEEQGHYWFDTQPSVTKTASDYAERLREDVETVWNELVQRLRGEERVRGEFDRVHVAPDLSADVPDLENTRLVIVHPRYARRKQDGADSAAHQWVRGVVESKGASQRVHRNTLVFLMADKSELEGLEATTRSYLGWKRVQATSDSLNLSTQQRKQTDEWVARLNQTVSDRIRETFAWALYPEQFDPTKPFEIVSDKVPDSAGRSLAERVGAKLGRDGQLVTELGAPILGATLHEELGALWSSAREMSVGELWGYFTRYVYLPRLSSRGVLDAALDRALNAVLVDRERFAIASGKDPETGRYRGLIVPPNHKAALQITDSTMLVDWPLAEQQAQAERAEATRRAASDAAGEGSEHDGFVDAVTPSPEAERTIDDRTVQPDVTHSTVRYFGSVKVDPTRYSRDIGNVTREVIDRLVGAGARIEITVDVQATKSDGFSASEIRTISENTRVLKFDPSSGFEI
jgi:predicted AAA+ superfamily ATPase